MMAAVEPEDSEDAQAGVTDMLALVEPLASPDTKQLSIDEARHAMEQLAWLNAASSQGMTATSVCHRFRCLVQCNVQTAGGILGHTNDALSFCSSTARSLPMYVNACVRLGNVFRDRRTRAEPAQAPS